MNTLGGNSEIIIEGASAVFSSFAETIVRISRTGTYSATYVDVTYYSGLGLPTTRYWFDANGVIILPLGDLLRAYFAGGYGGGITVTFFTAVDDADGTAANCDFSIFDGLPPVVPDVDVFPPRHIVSYDGVRFDTLAFPAFGHSVYNVSYCNSGTWTTPVMQYSDGGGFGGLYFTIKSIPVVVGDIIKVNDWTCEVAPSCCATCRLKWKADLYGEKEWAFEVVSVTRSVDESLQTEGEGVLLGTFYPTEKNWHLSIKVVVRDLTPTEEIWFDDLLTGKVATIKNFGSIYDRLATYLAVTDSPAEVVVTDKKKERKTANVSTNDLTFTLDIMQVRNF